MRNRLLILLLITTFFLNGHAQEKYSFEKDKVTAFELVMKNYEEDPDAEAVVIYEIGNNYFRGDETYNRRSSTFGRFLMHKEISTKIKILTEAGLKYATFEIPLYTDGADPETLDINKATIYNIINGEVKKTEYDQKNIFEEKTNENWINKKFTLPDVQVGSVIELDYTINSPYYFNMGDWEFQKRIPVIYSKLYYRAIPYYEYIYLVKSIEKFDEFESNVLNGTSRFRNLEYVTVEYGMGMKNIPAFKDEEFITSPKDHMIALKLQLAKINYTNGGSQKIMTTYPLMCDAFLRNERIGKYIKKSQKEAKKILPVLALADLSKEEQLIKIVEYVKQTYRWNDFYGKYAQDDLSTFLKNKSGNVGNINLFLIGMLEAAKLDVVPVVLSTRSNGMPDKKNPFESFFNYIIAAVDIDGKRYFIDGTEPFLPFDKLPERCINVEGLIVKNKTEEWIQIKAEEPEFIENKLTIKISPDENKQLNTCVQTINGYQANEYRKLRNKQEDIEKQIKEQYNIDIMGEINIENGSELYKELVLSYTFNKKVENINNKLFIEPFSCYSISKNPFTQNTRILPVDMVTIKETKYKSTIEIPDGYVIESLPTDTKMNNKMITFSYVAAVTDNKIEVESAYTTKKVIYQPHEYQSLKQSYELMMKKLSEMVVLVKKE